MYNKRKSAQLAAYFAKQEGGRINYMKLLKLMYLVEREALLSYGYSVTEDDLVLMKFGPVLSGAYDALKSQHTNQDEWSFLFQSASGYDVTLKTPQLSRDDFDHLSDYEVGVAANIWERFKNHDQWSLAEYTHTLPEWKDPLEYGLKKLPLTRETIALGENLKPEVAKEISEEIESQRRISHLFLAA
jgi:uncharacterized phage-associated protein